MRPLKSSLTVRQAVLFAGFTVALLVNRAPAAVNSPSDAEVKAIVRTFIERDHWSTGMVVGIVDEQGTRVIGYGNLDQGDSPEVNGDTLFEVGSITKTFTVLLLEVMLERGEMSLDDPVEKFLPASYSEAYDPAPGTTKRLRAEFRLAGGPNSVEVNEGETLEVPPGGEILKAIYGDLATTQRTADVTARVAALVKGGAARIRADNTLPVREAALRVPAWGARRLTLRDLATHRSGLPRELDNNTVGGLYDVLSHCRLPGAPGRKVRYSNVGLQLLGQAIAVKAGADYETLLRKWICQPLGMVSTCIQPSAELRPRLAKSHGQENRATTDLSEVLAPLPGSGAIRSTANDLLKYVAANVGLQKTPLTPLMERTHAVQVAHGFGDPDVGLVWFVYHRQGSELIAHGGDTSGQAAFIGFDKRAKRGVVVLANREDWLHQAVQPLGIYLLHPPAELPGPVSIASQVLDRYAGLYEFPDLPQAILALRPQGGRLITQFLNYAAGGDWVPVSETCFVNSWESAARMELRRDIGGRTTVLFSSPYGRSRRARRVSEAAPECLFLPMLQPLAAGECVPRRGSDLQGTWDVTARAWYWPFQARHGLLRVAEASWGVFRAEFDFPEQDANNQPVAVIYRPPGVELVARSGAGMFKGKVNSDHTKITGHFVQGHYSVGATLRRNDR